MSAVARLATQPAFAVRLHVAQPGNGNGRAKVLHATAEHGPRRLCSDKRRRARARAAEILSDAMRVSGAKGPDIAAMLDLDARDVSDMRASEKPFEVGHVMLLAVSTRAVVLGRLAAELPAEGVALMREEMGRVEREQSTQMGWEW